MMAVASKATVCMGKDVEDETYYTTMEAQVRVQVQTEQIKMVKRPNI